MGSRCLCYLDMGVHEKDGYAQWGFHSPRLNIFQIL